MTEMTTAPALLGISHGTSSAEGQAVVAALAREVALLAAGREDIGETRLGHVDVQQPDITATLDTLPEGAPAVLVPLLLSAGYHVNVDMKKESAAAEESREVRIAAALGPDERLAEVLARRLRQAAPAGTGPAAGDLVPGRDVIILGAAGSSDASAVRDVAETARLLSERLRVPVQDAYLSFAQPSVADAVAAARERSPEARIAVVSYLLAPGYFQDLLETKAAEHGADLVTESLLSMRDDREDIPEEIPRIVLDRFTAALPA